MASNFIFSVKTVKYGTPTGTSTMPATGDLTPFPDTVKGSITIEEDEGAFAEFFVDQKAQPIRVVKTEEGKLSANMQFYSMDYTMLAALKGGTADTSSYIPAVGFTDNSLAIQIETDSGHVFDFYNAQVSARITGGGGRDQMFAVEATMTPQLTADGLSSWKVSTKE